MDLVCLQQRSNHQKCAQNITNFAHLPALHAKPRTWYIHVILIHFFAYGKVQTLRLKLERQCIQTSSRIFSHFMQAVPNDS